MLNQFKVDSDVEKRGQKKSKYDGFFPAARLMHEGFSTLKILSMFVLVSEASSAGRQTSAPTQEIPIPAHNPPASIFDGAVPATTISAPADAGKLEKR